MRATTTLLCAAFSVVILVVTLSANATPGDLFASINGAPGNGAGAIYQYTPDGVQSTLASGLSRPRGLAFDSAGNLFVASSFCERIRACRPTISKITPDGALILFGTVPGGYFGEDVAIDWSDNVFVIAVSASFTHSIVYKFTPDGTRTRFAFIQGQCFGLAFDGVGNLYAAAATEATIYSFAPDGTPSVFVGPAAFTELEGGPIGLAFDHFGNLFVSTEVFPFTDDRILKFTPSGVKSTFATGLKSPRGLAFDAAGNLFVAEVPPLASGSILRFGPDGARSVFASGIGAPEGTGGPEFLAIQR